MSTVTRRTKWHPTPPPPPSPKILHFPRTRRTRRKHLKSSTSHHHHHHQRRSTNTLLLMHHQYSSNKGKLESLFDQENDGLNSNSRTLATSERRERVEEEEEVEEENGGDNNRRGGASGIEEEKWRFQAEILRAECNFLRMEREFALKKLEKNRVKMEKTLRSAVQTLVSGREKIFEGKNVNAVLEEEIEDLAEKLEELQKSSRFKDKEIGKCSNFDKKACVLQRRLEKLGGLSDENCSVKKSAESNLSVNESTEISNCKIKNKSINVDWKMEGLAKCRVGEECGSILSSTAHSSVASSASTSKRIDLSALSSSTSPLDQEPALNDMNKCSGRCKAIIRRIAEQVRAETEQWSQMQEMLRQVRGEMEQLQATRRFWENRAHASNVEIQTLRQTVEEWEEKALAYETKADELQLELSILKEELQKAKASANPCQNKEAVPNQDVSSVPLIKQLEKEKLGLSCRTMQKHYFDERRGKVKSYMDDDLGMEEIKARTPTKDFPPISLGKQLAKEKKMILHRMKENRHTIDRKGSKEDFSSEGRRKPQSNISGFTGQKRSPLKDIGNSPPLARQNPLQSPQSLRTRESFRK